MITEGSVNRNANAFFSDMEEAKKKKRNNKEAQKRWAATGSRSAPVQPQDLGLADDKTQQMDGNNKPYAAEYRPHHHLSKYRPEYDEMLVKHMKDGNSFWSFAAKINVNFDTLQDWCGIHPSFLEARRVGEAHLLLFDETAGKAGMLGKLKGFNAKVWETIVKNRWRRFYFDKREIKLDFAKPDGLKGLSDEDLQELLMEQLQNGVDEVLTEKIKRASKGE